MAEPFKVWQCIGCGRLEGPAQCVGICQDRITEVVDVSDLRAAEKVADELRAIVRRIATVTPREGEWERTYRALQQEARRLLG